MEPTKRRTFLRTTIIGLMLPMIVMTMFCLFIVPAGAAPTPWYDKQPTSLCRAASRFAVKNKNFKIDFVSGLPTFEYINKGIATEYGVIHIPPSIAFTKDVPESLLVSELGTDITSFRQLVIAANRYARNVRNIGAGYPTCETVINKEGERVWGVVFISKDAIQSDYVTERGVSKAIHFDVELTERERDWWPFRAANRYADTFKPAFATGFLTGEYTEMFTSRSGERVRQYEIVKFKAGAIIWQDAKEDGKNHPLGIIPNEQEDQPQPVEIDPG